MDCNISQLIRDTYIRFNPAAQQNGLKFQTDLPEQDFNAPVDKEALTKILSNLFNNAVKYATSSIHVSLIPPCGMKEPGYFSIMVSNDGHPIPHDMQEKIFQPFVQIKQTSGGQRTAGTGIGLPLARSLAELHKGKLYLRIVKKSVSVSSFLSIKKKPYNYKKIPLSARPAICKQSSGNTALTSVFL